MRERASRRPQLIRNTRGGDRKIYDIDGDHYALWINGGTGGAGITVPANPLLYMRTSVPGATKNKQFISRVWYQGSVAPTWPVPSPEAFAWGEVIFATRDLDEVFEWATGVDADLQIKRLIVEDVTPQEWCAWADTNILQHGTPTDLEQYETTLAARLENCPNLLAALQNRTATKIVLMGDSFQGLTGAGPAPFLRRSYPGLNVSFDVVALGSHGAEQWVAEGQTVINNALRAIDPAPDAVFFGGISSVWENNTDWLTLVDMIRIALPDVEIVLASDARGAHGTETSAIVQATATAKGCGFHDAALMLDTWVAASGWDINDWKYDGVHFDMRGGLVLARGWAWFMGASASIAIPVPPESVAPEVTAFVVPATSDSLTVPVTTFTATDNIGVTRYLITEASSTPSISNPGWSATAQTEFVFSTEGSKTLYAWARDAAGNVSASATDSVVVDLLPAIPAGLGSASVTSTGFTLTWSAAANATGYQVYQDGVSIGTTANTSLAVSGLDPETSYSMTVRSYDGTPNYSAQSSALPIETEPDAPTMTATPSFAVEPSTTGNKIALTGSGTAWDGSTTFTVSGGATVTRTQVLGTGSALLTVTVPSGTGDLTVSDGTLSDAFSRSAAIDKTIDWVGRNLHVCVFGASDMHAHPDSDLQEAARVACGCPADRWHDYSLGATSILVEDTIGLLNRISLAITNGHYGPNYIAWVGSGVATNQCLLYNGTTRGPDDASRCTDSAVVTSVLSQFGTQLDRLVANYGQILINEQSSHSTSYASDGLVYFRGRLDTFLAARNWNRTTHEVPIYSVIGTTGTYYVEQGPPPGPHLDTDGTAAIAPMVADRLYRVANNVVTMTATPSDVVRRSSTGNTIAMAGTNTTWTGSPFSIASGGGTITAQSVTDADTATITYTAPSGSATVVITDGTATASFAVVVPSISVSPVTVEASSTGNTLVVTGVNSGWTAGTPGTPELTVSTGATITGQVCNSATQITLTVTAGASPATITVTDPLRSATTTFAVEEAGALPWVDDFERADGVPGNGWSLIGAATHQIASGIYRRTDTGDARISYNMIGGDLPADYFVSFFVPNSTSSVSNVFWGVLGRFNGTGGANSGVGVFWPGTGRQFPVVNFGEYATSPEWTYAGSSNADTQVPTWDENILHMVTLEFSGTTVRLYLDGVLFGSTTSSVGNEAARGIAIIGDRWTLSAIEIAGVIISETIPSFP